MKTGYETRKSECEKRNTCFSVGKNWTFHNRFAACRAQSQLLLGEARWPLSPKWSGAEQSWCRVSRGPKKSRLSIDRGSSLLPKASTSTHGATVCAIQGPPPGADILSGRGWRPRWWLSTVPQSVRLPVVGPIIDHLLISQDRKRNWCVSLIVHVPPCSACRTRWPQQRWTTQVCDKTLTRLCDRSAARVTCEQRRTQLTHARGCTLSSCQLSSGAQAVSSMMLLSLRHALSLSDCHAKFHLKASILLIYYPPHSDSMQLSFMF